MQMTSSGKGFNKVFDNVKILEMVTQMSQTMMLAKKSPNFQNFNGFYSKSHGQ